MVRLSFLVYLLIVLRASIVTANLNLIIQFG